MNTEDLREDGRGRVRKYLVSGRVQGVSFRWFTTLEARQRGLRGTVQNLRDGRVQVLVVDDGSRPERFEDFLRQIAAGPPASRVDGVEECEVSPAEIEQAAGRKDFEIVH